MQIYLDKCFVKVAKTTVTNYVEGFDFDMYVSPGNTETKKPVLIFLHGGGGKKEDPQPVSWAQDEAATRGYIGIAASYKHPNDFDGEPHFGEQEQKIAVQNVWSLIYHLRKNSVLYGVKKNRIFVVGESAGAVTAIQAAVALNNRKDPYFDQTIKYSKTMVIAGSATLSGACTEVYQAMIDASDPKNRFYHGVDDHTVEYAVAVQTHALMMGVGICDKNDFMPFDADHKLGHQDEIVADLFPAFGNILGNMVKPYFPPD